MWHPQRTYLKQAEQLCAQGRRDDAFHALRRLSIRRFGELLLGVPDRFESLRAMLPEMPSERVQRDWTGNHGSALLQQSCAFVQSVERAYSRICSRPLEGATILDYGCGWGRILRLMYRYSDPDLIYGVDPDPAALAICRATRVLGHLAQCDHIPQAIPFRDVTFDLVYAFSVFTHLSENTATAVMDAIRSRIKPDGLLVLTVRPVEYWAVSPEVSSSIGDAMRRRHLEQGFAFFPFNVPPIGGEVTFGDTSISIDYMRRNWQRQWKVEGEETSRRDQYQRLVFLRPR